MKRYGLLVVFCSLFAQPASYSASLALGAAFTYQGRLLEGTDPANGVFDLRFALFDTVTSGTQVGSTLSLEDVTVTNGLFMVSLDFSSAPFTGEARWLEIAVRPGADAGSFTTLVPRQELSAAPYALNALNLMSFAGQPLVIKAGGVRALRLDTPPGGHPNVIGGDSSFVTSFVSGAFIGSGEDNRIVGPNFNSVIAGGESNFINSNSTHSVIGGGDDNEISAGSVAATIGGGVRNRIQAGSDSAAIAGGQNNLIFNSIGGFIGGGDDNDLQSAHHGTIGGGADNQIFSNTAGTIAGGDENVIQSNSHYSAIGGGFENKILANGPYAAIAGGGNNVASGRSAFVGGGGGFDSGNGGPYPNHAHGDWSVIGGGWWNTNHAYSGAIAGGGRNEIRGNGTSFANNAAFAAIGGGFLNHIHTNADYAVVPGGRQARATQYGQFVHASGGFDVSTPGQAQTSVFVVRNTTASTTPTELFLDGNGERMGVPIGAVWAFDALVVGVNSARNLGGYRLTGLIANDGGNTGMQHGFIRTPLGATLTATVEALADNPNDALVIRVTSANSTPTRWVATVRTVEVLF